MTNIAVFFVSGGNPDIILNGEYFEMRDEYLSLKKELIHAAKETPGFQFVKSVMAWKGEVVAHTKDAPAQNLLEAVSFKSITFDEGEKNTQDHEFIDKLYPVLALLVWRKSAHFINHGNSSNFECLVCGRTHFTPYTPRYYHSTCPVFCESPKCYSHEIWKMLDPEYTVGKKARE